MTLEEELANLKLVVIPMDFATAKAQAQITINTLCVNTFPDPGVQSLLNDSTNTEQVYGAMWLCVYLVRRLPDGMPIPDMIATLQAQWPYTPPPPPPNPPW